MRRVMLGNLVSPTRRLYLWSVLAALCCVQCGDGRTPLVVYSPHGRDLLTVVEEEYERLYPEIDVRWLDMGSQEVYDRIRSERANPQADVWFGGPHTIFARAASDGLLASFRPTWAARLGPSDCDAEGRFCALYRTPTLIVYNSDAVTAQEAPSDWPDLLDERWRDRIIIRDPLASGTMRTIFGFLVADSLSRTGSADEGFAYLKQLDQQTKEYVHSPALLHEKIIRQEGLVTLWEMTDILTRIDGGAPMAYRFPSSGTPVIADAVALVEGARRREEAERFIEWLGSEDALVLAAERAFRLPAPSGIEPARLPPWTLEVRETLVPAEVDWTAIEASGPEWMAHWDRAIRASGK